MPLLLTCTLSSPAAAWKFNAGEDPMTDKKFAVISDGDYDVGIGFKCWEGAYDSTKIIIMTSLPFDASANYANSIDVQVRVDKGPISNFEMYFEEIGGKVGFSTNHDNDRQIVPLIKSIGASQSRLALSFGGKVMSFPAKGARKAVDRFLATCGF